jgi:arabinosaccharide transport system substrate-binding protein
MLGLAKSSRRSRANWEFAKHLYLSAEVAISTFRATGIVTPVKAHWTNPIFDEPDPFFCGQAIGREYLKLAPDIPPRPSSPYTAQAVIEVNNCLVQLMIYADRTKQHTMEELVPEAQRLLEAAQVALQAKLARNVFLDTAQ